MTGAGCVMKGIQGRMHALPNSEESTRVEPSDADADCASKQDQMGMLSAKVNENGRTLCRATRERLDRF